MTWQTFNIEQLITQLHEKYGLVKSDHLRTQKLVVQRIIQHTNAPVELVRRGQTAKYDNLTNLALITNKQFRTYLINHLDGRTGQLQFTQAVPELVRAVGYWEIAQVLLSGLQDDGPALFWHPDAVFQLPEEYQRPDWLTDSRDFAEMLDDMGDDDLFETDFQVDLPAIEDKLIGVPLQSVDIYEVQQFLQRQFGLVDYTKRVFQGKLDARGKDWAHNQRIVLRSFLRETWPYDMPPVKGRSRRRYPKIALAFLLQDDKFLRYLVGHAESLSTWQIYATKLDDLYYWGEWAARFKQFTSQLNEGRDGLLAMPEFMLAETLDIPDDFLTDEMIAVKKWVIAQTPNDPLNF